MIDALDRLGLSGAFQVHVAPQVLTLDDRAHQVFLGFESRPDAIGHALRHRLAPDSIVHVVGVSLERTTLTSMAPSYRAETAFVIERVSDESPGGLYALAWVVDRLLGPGGCPWDQAQTHHTLKRYLLEEAYELIEAIDRDDFDGMQEELGDVLLQPLMHTQIRKAAGDWDVDVVAQRIVEKLIRRHPHVFGDTDAPDADTVLKNWDRIKSTEKGDAPRSVLEGVPKALPALLRAYEVSKRAARNGFEWPNLEGVWAKFEEETQELKEAESPERRAEELGDLLFTVVNLARWWEIDAEDALRQMVDRFTERFRSMELAAERPLSELSADEWDRLWTEAKRETR